MTKAAKLFLHAFGLFLGAALLLCFADAAWAAQNSPIPDGICTDNPIFNAPAGGNQIISVVIENLKQVLLSMSSQVYFSIIGQNSYAGIIAGLLTLYVAIYGILFTLGMVEITVFDFMMRMVKVAVVGILVSPASWGFFMFYLNGIFVEGGNQLIAIMTSIGVGGVPGLSGSMPFASLDNAISNITSPRMAVSMGGMLFTGVYGVAFFGLIFMAIGTFMAALLQAVWVYIMALAMLTLLFGTAPIFIACLLFSRTKYLFDGWLNQLLNAVLQPVLLFTFFAFFSALVQDILARILSVPWCWETKSKLGGTAVPSRMWTPKYNGETGNWDFQGLDVAGMQVVFPIGITDVLAFILLAQLCGAMNHVVLAIAKNIAGASTDLNMSGVGQRVLSGLRGGGGGGSRGGGKGGPALPAAKGVQAQQAGRPRANPRGV